MTSLVIHGRRQTDSKIMLDVLTLGVKGLIKVCFFFKGNENRSTVSECDTPVEKYEAPCRTSEQHGHSFDEKRKTLGTNKDESSPRKEPPKDLFRTSHLESTSDPGMEKLSC